MSSIDPSILAAINGSSKGDSKQSNSNDELGQNQFLTLMLAQLKNQDPMKPQDPTQFLSQLAQFSQVTSSQKVEQKIGELNDSLRAAQVLNGTSLVGHDILASSDSATFVTGGSLKGEVAVPDGVSSVQIEVRDSAGALVRRYSVPSASGVSAFSWDGLTSGGEQAASGTYEVKATASVNGKTQSLDAMLYSKVNSVSIGSTGLVLNTGVGSVELSDVKRVM